MIYPHTFFCTEVFDTKSFRNTTGTPGTQTKVLEMICCVFPPLWCTKILGPDRLAAPTLSCSQLVQCLRQKLAEEFLIFLDFLETSIPQKFLVFGVWPLGMILINAVEI